MRWPVWRAAVAGNSMEPGLRPGDHVLLVRPPRSNRPVRVRAGQVVAARHPADSGLLLIKRAILMVPDGWLLDSDNPRAGADDSWRFGPVAPHLVEGRLLCRYWPPRHFRHFRRIRRIRRKSDPGGDGHADRPRPDHGT